MKKIFIITFLSFFFVSCESITHKQELLKLKNQNTNYLIKIENQNNTIEKYKSDISSLENKIVTKNQEITELNVDILKLNSEVSELNNTKSNQEKLSTCLASLTSEIGLLKASKEIAQCKNYWYTEQQYRSWECKVPTYLHEQINKEIDSEFDRLKDICTLSYK